MYLHVLISQTAKFMGSTWGPTWVLSAPDGSHVGPWTLLSGCVGHFYNSAGGFDWARTGVAMNSFLVQIIWIILQSGQGIKLAQFSCRRFQTNYNRKKWFVLRFRVCEPVSKRAIGLKGWFNLRQAIITSTKDVYDTIQWFVVNLIQFESIGGSPSKTQFPYTGCTCLSLISVFLMTYTTVPAGWHKWIFHRLLTSSWIVRVK